MTSSQSIDYEALQSEAMRSVVRAVLARTAKSGLPGEHHFYIAFDTTAPGVGLSKRLKEKYPREMTIVLQHRFWDLVVSEDRFEVKLTFDSIPERLVVPFAAIKVFFDPSVRYGLQFEEADMGLRSNALSVVEFDDDDARTTPTRSGVSRKPRTTRKPKVERAESDQAGKGAAAPATTIAAGPRNVTEEQGRAGALPQDDAVPPPAAGSIQTEPAANGGAQILELDRFRKK